MNPRSRCERGKEGAMKRSLTICLVVMTALAFSGCMVPKDSYTEAVQEADAARMELDRVHISCGKKT